MIESLLIMEESTAFLRMYVYRNREVSGSRVETLSSRPKAKWALSNLPRSPAVHSMGGFGGRGAGMKVRTFSSTVEIVTQRPRGSLIIITPLNLKTA